MNLSTATRAVGSSLLLTFTASCFYASGAGYRRVRIEASELAPDGMPLETEAHCLTLPLLLGSQVDVTFNLDSAIEISAEATRDYFTVTVEGVQSVSTSHDVEELDADFSESFEVTSDSGATFMIRLQSGC